VVNGSRDAKHRAMLLNYVVLGKPFKLQHNSPNLSSPPLGYHSVIGEPGAHLNYEETVVYTNAAIRPGYLLVYGGAPSAGIKDFVKTLFMQVNLLSSSDRSLTWCRKLHMTAQ
jgi:hypothetical protein